MSKINCKFCNKKFGKKAFDTHLSECISNSQNNKSGYLIEFMSQSEITNKDYSIFAIFGTKCKFSHIDNFLKRIWCECCGHMSTLDVYESINDDELIQKEIKFDILISKYELAYQFTYEYDMGTTTTIYFRIVKKLDGNDNNLNIDLVYQNEPFKLKCKFKCKKEALYTYEYDIICEECKNNVDEPECVLHIVNSPRVGMCGYEG